ncbi:MAG TPA: histidine phosphatase family protein [Nitrospiraceae bacterium]|nr:histidine phosphatase family protein [Nitrospiraceae bacterium]
MDCILFRHGIAVERDEWDGQEAKRPLTPRGIEKTQDAADGLARLEIMPTHLIVSPLVRALETAKIICDVLKFKDDVQRCEALLPDASPSQLIKWLAALPADARVICVGHEPNLGQSAAWMLVGAPAPGLSLKKAGACAIRFENEPKRGAGQLRWWLMPSQLRAMR